MIKPKYQVGDRVIVRSDLKVNTRYSMANGYGAEFIEPVMVKLAGQVVTIRYASSRYRVQEVPFTWTDEMFVGLASEMIPLEIDDLL